MPGMMQKLRRQSEPKCFLRKMMGKSCGYSPFFFLHRGVGVVVVVQDMCCVCVGVREGFQYRAELLLNEAIDVRCGICA
jgi:hypothetical protein